MLLGLNYKLLMGVLAGVAVGVAGAKYYESHRDEITDKLKNFKGCNLLSKNDEVKEDADLTLEELESQKERLEDLIADLQAKQGAK